MVVTQAEMLQLARRRDSSEWALWLGARLDRGAVQLSCEVMEPCALRAHAQRPGLEVFLRLVDDDGKAVAASAFMPSAIQHQLTARLDGALLGQLLARMVEKPQLFDAYQAVSMNVCGASLLDREFGARVVAQLRSHPAQARQMCFELDARFGAYQAPAVRAFVAAVRGAGAQVALDDWRGPELAPGLRELSFDWIKVHESQIRHVRSDATDRARLAALANECRVTGRNVVALGVEDGETWVVLCQLGVEFAQGPVLGDRGPPLR